MRAGVTASGRRPPFNPLTLPGLIGWYDASDEDTITLVDGGLEQWDDKSTEGQPFLYSSGVRPTIEAINGRPAVRSSSSGMYTTHDPLGSGPVTMIGAFQFTSTLLRRCISARGVDFLYQHSGFFRSYDGDYACASTKAADREPHVGTVYRDPGSTFGVRVDGGHEQEVVSGTRFASTIRLGSGEGNTIRIGELIVCTQILPPKTIHNVESYLAAKWGIPGAGV